MPLYPFPTSYSPPYIPDLNWAPLESASGLTFTDPQRVVLVNAMNHYLSCLAEVHATPKMRPVRKRCEDIRKLARPLAHLLRLHPTNDMRANDAELVLLQAVFGLFPIRMDRQSIARDLTHLALNTEKALEKLRGAGERGRQRKDEKRRMIRAWHAVYREAGGTGIGCWWSENSSQHEGPFLELLDAALRQAEMASQGSVIPAKEVRGSRESLGQMIPDVVSQPRKPRRQGKE